MLDHALAIINDSTILPLADFAHLAGMRAELTQTWETVQIFRTRTEMEYSVLNDLKLPTPDAKYWQCVREQNVMFGELVNLSYEYRKNDVEIRKELRKLDTETDPLERELIQIEIERKRFVAANMQRTAGDRIREIKEWSAIKAALLPQMKSGTEDVNAHQAESLPIRFKNMAAMCGPHTQPADAANLLGLHLTAQNRAKAPLTAVPVQQLEAA